MGLFFFFQAEDGIRDGHVTGVQTCALPISEMLDGVVPEEADSSSTNPSPPRRPFPIASHVPHARPADPIPFRHREIGRASCRERVEISVVAVALKKKRVGTGQVRLVMTSE